MKESMQNSILKMMDSLRGSMDAKDFQQIIFPLLALRYLEGHPGEIHLPDQSKWSEVKYEYYRLKERVIEALRGLEFQNPKFEGVFYSEVMEHMSEDVYRRVIPAVDQIDLNTEVFEELYHFFSRSEGRMGGVYITPQSLTHLIPSLLDIQGGSSIHDGAAGVGELLIKTGEYARGKGNDVVLYGQEINHATWALGKINLLLNGFSTDNFVLGNTITNPAFGNEQFDYVVMNFPFSLKDWGREKVEFDIYKRFPYGLPSNANADMVFIQHALSSLKPDGKAAIVVSHGTLFRGGADRNIRQGMIEDDIIETVIGLPSSLLYYTPIPVALLILNHNKPLERKGFIQFIDASEHFEKRRGHNVLREEDIQRIIKAYRSDQSIERYSVFIPNKQILESEANLTIHRYFDVNEVQTETFGTVQVNKELYEQSPDKKEKLKDLVEMYRGMNIPSKKEVEKGESDYYLIQLADVQEGEILFNQLIPIDTDSKKAGAYEVQEGDILLSSRGAAIKVAVVPKTDKKLILSHNFIGLRPKAGVNPYFIKAFLESPIGLFYITSQQKGTAVAVLTIKDIEEIPVPVPEEINDIGNAFLRADEELQNIIEKARQERIQRYLTLYGKMGLTEAFKTDESK